MGIKALLKKSSFPLALFMLLLISFYLIIKLFGYTFVPFNGLAINILTTGIIVWLTINGIKNRDKKTKTTVVFAMLLPLIAVSYLILKSISADIGGEVNQGLFAVDLTAESTMIYSMHAGIVLVCSMKIFFSCGRGKVIRIGLGIIYSILLLFICFRIFLMLIFSDFGKNTVEKSELSPNAKYLVEAIYVDSGALGGDIVVNVTQQNQDINLLIGELKKDPKRIHDDVWGEPVVWALRWETDEVLYINEVRYLVE